MSYSYKVISKSYISNCLFEALRAKLKNWKDVKIIKMPAFLTGEKVVHYYWKNLKTNLFYGFQPVKDGLCHFLFKGYIAEYDSKQQEAMINYFLRKLINSLELKLDFKSDFFKLIDNLSAAHWRYYSNSEKEVYTNNNNYDFIEGSSKDEKGNDIIKFYDIGEEGIENPNNDEILCWRIPRNGKPL